MRSRVSTAEQGASGLFVNENDVDEDDGREIA
jgi:hypothetical protein